MNKVKRSLNPIIAVQRTVALKATVEAPILMTTPCFAIDPNEGDFHLAWNSPCIDMGATDDPCADTTEKDIDGLPRVLDGDGDASLVVGHGGR